MCGAMRVFFRVRNHIGLRAIDGCLELPSVNNPAVKRGSPPCGINKTEELVKGMVEGRGEAPPPFLS